MPRRLLTALTVLSLLLCLAGGALWARSYSVADSITVRSGRRLTDFFSEGGSYTFRTIIHEGDAGREWARESERADVDSATALRVLAHFEWTSTNVFNRPSRYVIAPQWTVPAVFGILPAFRGHRWCRRHFARRRGFDIEPVTPTP